MNVSTISQERVESSRPAFEIIAMIRRSVSYLDKLSLKPSNEVFLEQLSEEEFYYRQVHKSRNEITDLQQLLVGKAESPTLDRETNNKSYFALKDLLDVVGLTGNLLLQSFAANRPFDRLQNHQFSNERVKSTLDWLASVETAITLSNDLHVLIRRLERNEFVLKENN